MISDTQYTHMPHGTTSIDRNLIDYAKTLIEVVPTPIFIKNSKLEYICCNKAFLDLFNIKLTDIVGKKHLIPDVLSTHAWDQEVMTLGGSIKFDLTVEMISNSKRYLEITSSQLQDSKHHPLGILGFVHDRTEEKMQKSHIEKLMFLKDSMIEITHVIMDNPSEQMLFNLMLQMAVQVIEHSNYGSVLMKDEHNVFHPVASIGFEKEAIANFNVHLHNTFNWMATNGHIEQSAMINDLRPYLLPNVPDLLDTEDQNIMRATICSPIIVDGQVIGLMNMDSPKLNAFSDLDMELVDYMSEQIEIALTKHKLYDRILYLSQHDELTGLLNRRQFENLANEKLLNCKKKDEPFLIVVFDLNGLKLINDTYGHQIGDAYIQAFAKEVKDLFRKGDYFGRYGGDEFIGLFSSMSKDTVKERLETMLDNLSTIPIIKGHNKIFISFSFGLATYPNDGISYEKLVSIADSHMYLHKEELKQG